MSQSKTAMELLDIHKKKVNYAKAGCLCCIVGAATGGVACAGGTAYAETGYWLIPAISCLLTGISTYISCGRTDKSAMDLENAIRENALTLQESTLALQKNALALQRECVKVARSEDAYDRLSEEKTLVEKKLATLKKATPTTHNVIFHIHNEEKQKTVTEEQYRFISNTKTHQKPPIHKEEKLEEVKEKHRQSFVSATITPEPLTIKPPLFIDTGESKQISTPTSVLIARSIVVSPRSKSYVKGRIQEDCGPNVPH